MIGRSVDVDETLSRPVSGSALSRMDGLPAGASRARGFAVLGPADDRRAAAEACIRDVYTRAFSANGLKFPPLILAWLSAAGDPVCAAGLRLARDGFFSERYLDRPIVDEIAARTGRRVGRESIFEVTTLASRAPSSSAGFLRSISMFGRSAGFACAFFTATAALRDLLCGLGIPLIDVAAADPARMGGASSWGSYYDHQPRVCAVDGAMLHPDGIPMRRFVLGHA